MAELLALSEAETEDCLSDMVTHLKCTTIIVHISQDIFLSDRYRTELYRHITD
jgi:hypothetical protein